MTFMLSSVRDDNVAEQTCSSGNKRKSLSFLPSSPTKLKRLDRSHSRGSSLSLLSASSLTTSTISRLSSFSSQKSPKRSASPSSRKSPPTCTISLENVTVNICDEDRNLSRSFARPIRDTPLETVDVNVIPFPSATSDESEPQPSSSFPVGRRRRSNHLLLGHRRSSSVHSISSPHRKENPPSSAPSSPPRRQSTPSKKSKPRAADPQSSKTASYSFKDMRFFALIRRSISHGIIWREQMALSNKMDVDNVESSGSVTFDILSDDEEEEADENIDPLLGKQRVQDRIMHGQDVLLVDRLSKILADWGYREREPLAPLSSLPSHLRMPLAPVALSAVTVSTPSFAVTVNSEPVMMPVAAPTRTIVLPDLDGHATCATFFDDISLPEQNEVVMGMDVDRPERPTSPVARFLEPTDENDAPMADVETAEPCRQPLTPSLTFFGPSSSDSSTGFVPLQTQLPIVAPTPIPSPPPVSPFTPGSHSSPHCVLSPSQLVATLVLRHREKMAVRYRGCHSQGGNGDGLRKRSPLARELYAEY